MGLSLQNLEPNLEQAVRCKHAPWTEPGSPTSHSSNLEPPCLQHRAWTRPRTALPTIQGPNQNKVDLADEPVDKGQEEHSRRHRRWAGRQPNLEPPCLQHRARIRSPPTRGGSRWTTSISQMSRSTSEPASKAFNSSVTKHTSEPATRAVPSTSPTRLFLGHRVNRLSSTHSDVSSPRLFPGTRFRFFSIDFNHPTPSTPVLMYPDQAMDTPFSRRGSEDLLPRNGLVASGRC